MPGPAATQPASPETPPRGGVLALLRLSAGDAHVPATCLPRGSSLGEWDLCDGCREALSSRIAALAEHLQRSEGNVWLLCTIRGLQELVSREPLPVPLRARLRPFGPPSAVAEARYVAAMGAGLAADLVLEEEQEQAQAAIWAELVKPKRAQEASDGR